MERVSTSKSYIVFSVVRFIQFALALTVCGLYGVDLGSARKAGVRSDGRWVYAVVLGVLSAVTALVYMIPMVARKVPLLFAWDAILFFLWIVLFGIFGKLFINERAEGDGGIQRMKNAVWVVLVNMLLWLLTAVAMATTWWQGRHSRTTFTGRAHV